MITGSCLVDGFTWSFEMVQFSSGSPYRSTDPLKRKWYPQNLFYLFHDPNPIQHLGNDPIRKGKGYSKAAKWFEHGYIAKYFVFLCAFILLVKYTGLGGVALDVMSWCGNALVTLVLYTFWIPLGIFLSAIPIAIWGDRKNREDYNEKKAAALEELAEAHRQQEERKLFFQSMTGEYTPPEESETGLDGQA